MNMNAHMTNLLGQSLGKLAPLIERAAEVLDQRGTRDLRNRIEKEFHNAVTLQKILQRAEDNAPVEALADFPRSTRARGHRRPCPQHLRLVVDNDASHIG